MRSEALQWLPELGIGWYPVREQPYDGSYWDRYRAMDTTPAGDQLTAMRIDLVAQHWSGALVDVGVGGGRFVAERGDTRGFDVNARAVAWLHERGLWCDPYEEAVDAVSFWDSLEHIHDPAPLLANVRRFVFASLPIFGNVEHVLRSKHYRRDEHCWYFTSKGVSRFMRHFGFDLVHADQREQGAGRQDIGSFVFKRAA